MNSEVFKIAVEEGAFAALIGTGVYGAGQVAVDYVFHYSPNPDASAIACLGVGLVMGIRQGIRTYRREAAYQNG